MAGLADSLLVAAPQDWLPYRDTRYVELFVVVDKTEVPWGGAGRGGVGQGQAARCCSLRICCPTVPAGGQPRGCADEGAGGGEPRGQGGVLSTLRGHPLPWLPGVPPKTPGQHRSLLDRASPSP